MGTMSAASSPSSLIKLVDLTQTAPFTRIEALCGTGNLLVIAPHPDDESVGCGGGIALAAESGKHIAVAVVTDGSLSHPASKTHPPAALAALRKQEVQEALTHLAPGRAQLHWMAYPDCGAPDALDDECAAVSQLIAIADATGATAVWTTWSQDLHPDHLRCFALAKAMQKHRGDLRYISYSVFGRFAEMEASLLPRAEKIMRLETTSVQSKKAAALAAHRSQTTDLIQDDPEGFVFEPAVLNDFIHEPEIYIQEF